jgi:hypothetical protein
VDRRRGCRCARPERPWHRPVGHLHGDGHHHADRARELPDRHLR